MWRKAEELLAKAEKPVSLSSLYAVWMAPPYGVRRGVLPILAMAFILTHQSSVAVYAEGAFQPDTNDFVADRLLQDERLISLRFVVPRADNTQLMKELARTVGGITGEMPVGEPLAVARALVEFTFRLPAWTRRTSSLSKAAQGVRRVLLNASDPHRALFVDLPTVVATSDDESAGAGISAALGELADAYQVMLDDLRDRMLNALGHRGSDYKELRRRARAVSGVSGDLRLEAFVTRIAEFNGCQKDMESVAGLVAHKPVREVARGDVLAEHRDVAEPGAPVQRQCGQACHPGSGEEIRHHLAGLRERLDEGLDRADRHLRQVGVAVVDRIGARDRDRFWERYGFRLHGQKTIPGT
jgi:hypothetical protein